LTVSRCRAPGAGRPIPHSIALLAAMVIVSPNRTVNRFRKLRGNPVKQQFSLMSQNARTNCVQIRFIAMLKLPFKFDRS
jgi:hypothetical protein